MLHCLLAIWLQLQRSEARFIRVNAIKRVLGWVIARVELTLSSFLQLVIQEESWTKLLWQPLIKIINSITIDTSRMHYGEGQRV